MNYQTIIVIRDLWKILVYNKKLQLFFLLSLNLLSSVAEIVSIGSVIPFLAALTTPEKLLTMDWFQPFIYILEIEKAEQLLLPLTLLFILIAIIATGIKVLLLWFNAKFATQLGIELSTTVFRHALLQPYQFHISHNSSELISVVSEKVTITINVGILNVLKLITSIFISISIILTLIVVDPIVALITFVVLGGGYILFGFLVRKKITIQGKIISSNQPKAIQCTQEGLGGIRDIIINNSQNIFIKTYKIIIERIQLASMKNGVLVILPKLLLELFGILLIAIMAYYLQVNNNVNSLPTLSILGVLALGSQRLLPALQQVYYSLSTINSAHTTILDVLFYLKQPVEKVNNTIKPLVFQKKIEIENLSFRYSDETNYILNNINLTINKGDRIGFIGATGSGKSTLVDIIMGLLVPSQGNLKIDTLNINNKNTKNWQRHIAHVPQNIFLADASLYENIAFGIPLEEIDFEKVKLVAEQAKVSSYINTLKDGYYTSIGERGIQLSGGQRQRIGIARALYKDADVIVFDEATSALDDTTEKEVMKAIDKLDQNLTIIIIAHRLTTLKLCNTIYHLDKGTIVEFGSYENIVLKKNYDR